MAPLWIGGLLLRGAMKGSLARTVSLMVLVSYRRPVVCAETGLPSNSMILVSMALSSCTSIMAKVIFLSGSTLKPGMSAPSIRLPEAEPGQASVGTLDCQSRPWSPSLVQEHVADSGRSVVE